VLPSSIAEVFEGSDKAMGACRRQRFVGWFSLDLGGCATALGVQQALLLPSMDMGATPATRFFGPAFVGAPGSRGVVLFLFAAGHAEPLSWPGRLPAEGPIAAKLPVLE